MKISKTVVWNHTTLQFNWLFKQITCINKKISHIYMTYLADKGMKTQ